MNGPPELIQLQALLWNLRQDAGQGNQAVAAVKSFVSDLVIGSAFPLSIAALFFLGAVLFYHPRVQRGAIWIPAFGVFGGTPKFYSHSRPASWFGVFLGSRRRRTPARRSRK